MIREKIRTRGLGFDFVIAGYLHYRLVGASKGSDTGTAAGCTTRPTEGRGTTSDGSVVHAALQRYRARLQPFVDFEPARVASSDDGALWLERAREQR